MFLFKTAKRLQEYSAHPDRKGSVWGFVPTMGALHEGHLDLIRQARSECDLVACSIFVNPTQFNDPADLEKYPRTESADIEALLRAACDLLFLPPVEEVYPPQGASAPTFEFGALDKVMEGAFRPGHFQGVAQVVSRLLEMVRPDRLYMGQKDYQQFVIVQEMLRQTKSPVSIVRCPTRREPHGLAMSSRNVRLSSDQRARAQLLYQTLLEAKDRIGRQAIPDICTWAMQRLAEPTDFEPEYFEIVDGATLQPPTHPEEAPSLVACTAVRVGAVRLIDNVIIREEENG